MASNPIIFQRFSVSSRQERKELPTTSSAIFQSSQHMKNAPYTLQSLGTCEGANNGRGCCEHRSLSQYKALSTKYVPPNARYTKYVNEQYHDGRAVETEYSDRLLREVADIVSSIMTLVFSSAGDLRKAVQRYKLVASDIDHLSLSREIGTYTAEVAQTLEAFYAVMRDLDIGAEIQDIANDWFHYVYGVSFSFDDIYHVITQGTVEEVALFYDGEIGQFFCQREARFIQRAMQHVQSIILQWNALFMHRDTIEREERILRSSYMSDDSFLKQRSKIDAMWVENISRSQMLRIGMDHLRDWAVDQNILESVMQLFSNNTAFELKGGVPSSFNEIYLEEIAVEDRVIAANDIGSLVAHNYQSVYFDLKSQDDAGFLSIYQLAMKVYDLFGVQQQCVVQSRDTLCSFWLQSEFSIVMGVNEFLSLMDIISNISDINALIKNLEIERLTSETYSQYLVDSFICEYAKLF